MKYILTEEYKSLSNYGIVGVRRNIERSFKSCSWLVSQMFAAPLIPYKEQATT